MDTILELVENRLEGDIELVRLAQGGSREAFDTLYQRHRQFIYSVCRHIIGSSEDAADVTQAAFIQAYRSLRSFRGGSSFRSWLCRIAINGANEVLRKEQRRRTLAGRMDVYKEPDRPKDKVLETVQALPVEHRVPLVLCYFQGLSGEEMAESLGCSIGAARTRLHRARAAFKKRYEENEP